MFRRRTLQPFKLELNIANIDRLRYFNTFTDGRNTGNAILKSSDDNTNVLIKQSINELEEEIKEGVSEDSEVEFATCVSKGMLRNSTLEKYKSLGQFNSKRTDVPKLSNNLSSTLFSSGVHYLRDPRTGHVNYDKSLLHIPHIDQFKMDKISNFTPSSRDNALLNIANVFNGFKKNKNKNNNKTNTKADKAIEFYSSTSSLTSILTKFHKLLSNDRPINTINLSKYYPENTKFTMTSEFPTSVIVSSASNNGIYSVDADKSGDSEITLSILGNALELMLTKSPKEFQKYLNSSTEEVGEDKNCYHYAKIGKFLVRSQLDAYHPELPGTGTFDIKTRAVCAIRHDIVHTDYYPTNYEITKTHGLFESFERELFDASRIVMFKYGLQARLGNMDGIFMAFHNIKKFLGFQYLPLSEIDNIFFGDYYLNDKVYGKRVFERSTGDDSSDSTADSNQRRLKSIINDIGNHYQSKREMLSSYVAERELLFSMKLFETVLKTALKDTNGRPFRIMMKKMPLLSDTEKEQIAKKAEAEKTKDSESGSSPNTGSTSTTSSTNNTNKHDSIVFLVNTLTGNELKEVHQLSSEKINACKSLLKGDEKEMVASERIKFFSENSDHLKKKYFKLNQEIHNHSESDNGFFVYRLDVQQLFNNCKSTLKFPIPSIKILDNEKDYHWDMKYRISKINRKADKDAIFNKFVKNFGMLSFKNPISEEENIYLDNFNLRLDHSATELQNIVRAYSVKAAKRNQMFNLSEKEIPNKK